MRKEERKEKRIGGVEQGQIESVAKTWRGAGSEVFGRQDWIQSTPTWTQDQDRRQDMDHSFRYLEFPALFDAGRTRSEKPHQERFAAPQMV